MNRIEKRGKVTIYDQSYVLKHESDLSKLYNYLLSRDFHFFLPILERNDDLNRYEYKENYTISDEQLGQDIANSLASLHNKTSYSKEVSIDNYKEIYDGILGYANYVEQEYTKLIEKVEYVEYPSPSELLFLTNYSKIIDAISFVKREINSWYGLVKDKRKARVVLNHGQMNLEHAIDNDKTYLISWEKNVIDSPIVDIINFYKSDWDKIEFSSVLEKYFAKCEWTNEEKKLLFINLSMPSLISFKNDEFENVINIRKMIDYLYKTESLIGPYYSKENEK